jgi:hypothetical protein
VKETEKLHLLAPKIFNKNKYENNTLSKFGLVEDAEIGVDNSTRRYRYTNACCYSSIKLAGKRKQLGGSGSDPNTGKSGSHCGKIRSPSKDAGTTQNSTTRN